MFFDIRRRNEQIYLSTDQVYIITDHSAPNLAGIPVGHKDRPMLGNS
jgi:hypothetical protein